MRIRSVTAHAFGPLAGETLELAECMTVIVGDNESGKSSWHAAIYAAVCGRRRGKGQPRKEEQRFIQLHQPWDRAEWLVTAEVLLDDGRRIELRHDLAGKVDCHAKDLVLGDDISSEVMNDGAPDGARWLGLDRTSFASTACVEQADLFRVVSDADGLQETLQRAAATAGTDATAAAALECLEAFRRDHVGLDRANSTRPLRRAIDAVQDAEAALREAESSHLVYLERVEGVEELRLGAHEAQQMLAAFEAAAASYAAQQLGERLRQAEGLHVRLGGVAPPGAADDDDLANAVASALASWRTAPAPANPAHRGSAEIQQEIAELPQAPDGDTVVHESVRLAEAQLERVEAQLQQHDRNRPVVDAGPVPQVAAGDDELLDLARALESPLPTVPPELVQRERAAQLATAGRAGATPPRGLLVGAIGAVILGLAAFVIGQPAIGGILAAAGISVGIGGFLRGRGDGARERSMAAGAAARAALLAAQQQVVVEQRRAWAIQRCAELGLPTDAAAVREVPVARAKGQSQATMLKTWTEQRETLAKEFAKAAGGLAGALAARGHAAEIADLAALHAAADTYRAACTERATRAGAAARRSDLMQQLDAAHDAERRLAVDIQARDAAASRLLEVAHHCGIACDSPEQAEPALVEWQQQRGERIARLTDAQREWTQLKTLLGGDTLEGLRTNATAAAAKAERLAAVVTPDALASIDAPNAEAQLASLREAEANARSLAASADGELRQFAQSVVSVAEAEEALGRAREDLARVRGLQETLDLTIGFLESAQERVHRDIAPLLADTVRGWLPKITNGRYLDVIVNPTSLEVQVAGAGGTWRSANLLSYGTSEQIYLLLRIALADHLTRGHDTCPLLLDDVTVHADASRTVDILNLLHEASKQRQIVLFTQEADVAAWAREALAAPNDTLIELPRPRTP